MQIFLNGDVHCLAESISVAEFLAQQGLAQRRIAVEVNCSIVPKSQHGQHLLNDGDKVEIVHALGGG